MQMRAAVVVQADVLDARSPFWVEALARRMTFASHRRTKLGRALGRAKSRVQYCPSLSIQFVTRAPFDRSATTSNA